MKRRSFFALATTGTIIGGGGYFLSQQSPPPQTGDRKPPAESRAYGTDAIREITRHSIPRVTALDQGPSGDWWILETSLDTAGLAAVYGYTTDWARNGVAVPLNLREHQEQPAQITDFSPIQDGWLVLDEYNTLHKFDLSWNYTGIRHDLPTEEEREYATPNGRAIDSTADGWWVSAYRKLILYDLDLQRVKISYDTYDDLRSVGRLLELFATPSGRLIIRNFDDSDLLVYDSPTETDLSTISPTTLTPDPNPSEGHALAGESSGTRYTVTGDGKLYEYSTEWEGIDGPLKVGSGNAWNSYPSDDGG